MRVGQYTGTFCSSTPSPDDHSHQITIRSDPIVLHPTTASLVLLRRLQHQRSVQLCHAGYEDENDLSFDDRTRSLVDRACRCCGTDRWLISPAPQCNSHCVCVHLLPCYTPVARLSLSSPCQVMLAHTSTTQSTSMSSSDCFCVSKERLRGHSFLVTFSSTCLSPASTTAEYG